MRTSLVAALLLASPAIAAAAPLAAMSADVEGTGAPVAIELGGDGVVHVGGARVALGDPLTKAALEVAPVHGKPAILAHVTSVRGDEAVILTRAAAWQIAWRGPVGAVGDGDEYAIDVAATPAGIVRYQSRFGVTRCDHQRALLFAEDFDGGKFARAGKLPLELAAGTPLLVAKLDAQPAEPPLLYKASAESTRKDAADAGSLAVPNELDDGRADTAWRTDGGVEGQFFTFKPLGNATARQLRVLGGDHGAKTRLDAANRPHELAIVGEHVAWRVELPDAAQQPLGAAYVVDLPAPVGGCLSVIVASTYGARGETAISELEIYADGERANGGEGTLADIVAKDGPDARSAGQRLAHGGAKSVAALDAQLARTSDAGVRRRLVRVLAEVRDPTAAPLLARAATSGWIDGRELIAVAESLGRMQQWHELRELAGDAKLALDVRIAAASAIDPGAPDGLAALVELAGDGPRELRRAVIERLQAAPASALVAAANAQAGASASGDLWRAATRAARHRAAERPAVLAAITAALPAASDYERRYRFVDGIAALGDAPALAALTTWLGALPAGTDAAALRQVAAAAIAVTPRPEAADLLLSLVRDLDPGVRMAALTALLASGDPAASPDASDRAIGERLARDSWEDVRVRAAQALGGRCARTEPAALLVTAVGKDRAIGVRTEALVALVHCHAGGVAELLARTWNDAKAPIALRTRAINLAIALGDPALGARLVGQLAGWRGAALESAPALALAVQAENAIGKLGAPGADIALMDALDDAAFPEIVGAAASGLGSLGAACPPAAKAKLHVLAHSDDLQIAVPARGAAAACGRAPQ